MSGSMSFVAQSSALCRRVSAPVTCCREGQSEPSPSWLWPADRALTPAILPQTSDLQVALVAYSVRTGRLAIRAVCAFTRNLHAQFDAGEENEQFPPILALLGGDIDSSLPPF